MAEVITVGVLALQGAFSEHMQLLGRAFSDLESSETGEIQWKCLEVRTRADLDQCDALIIPGGESTAISLVAARSGLLEAMRKADRKPTWGTCAGLILLAEAANRTKQGGQELIGGLDVRVNRNHFGRQLQSFETDLDLSFLRDSTSSSDTNLPFRATFIRAPIVERILPRQPGVQEEEEKRTDTVVAPSQRPSPAIASVVAESPVEVLATLPSRQSLKNQSAELETSHANEIIAVRQGNAFGTSFHPELSGDARIHVWWLKQVRRALRARVSNQYGSSTVSGP